MRGATLLIDRRQVASLVTLADAIDTVESAFLAYGAGGISPPAVLDWTVPRGSFHAKAAGLSSPSPRFTLKINSNFPENGRRRGLPTIQGMIALFDEECGRPLALMDSIEVTILRTAAATAVAARHLAREDATSLMICGCGAQARAQLRAVAAVRPIRRALLYDVDVGRAERLVRFARAEGLEVRIVHDLRAALRQSDVCVTCTTATEPFVRHEDLAPGAFIAAVGADSREKQELEASVLTSATIVVDLLGQCAEIGELHHAIEAGVMVKEDVHAELADVVAGRKPGRRRDDEIIVFDSTGTALQDAALAGVVYDRAVAEGIGLSFDLSSDS